MQVSEILETTHLPLFLSLFNGRQLQVGVIADGSVIARRIRIKSADNLGCEIQYLRVQLIVVNMPLDAEQLVVSVLGLPAEETVY